MNNEPDRLLLEPSYSADGDIVDAEWQFLRRSDISIFELPALKAIGESLRESRLRKAATTKGFIGRNDPCPCAPGKKFKKYCLSTN